MSLAQTNFWEEERMTPPRAWQLTRESLLAYCSIYSVWAVAFSGGKDSTAALTIIAHLIRTKQVPAPKILYVLYADTRMELPPLQVGARRLMAALSEQSERGLLPCRVITKEVLPTVDDRFYVYMLGRGIPPPTNTFRWCTAQIKVEPMIAALRDVREAANEKVLMLTGVRVGESAVRDQRIALSCSKNGAECGQGWFQETTPQSVADTLAPLLHWRVCHVWDWLRNEAPKHGYPTSLVADVYGGNRAEEVNARTGCVGCNLASRDVALERVLAVPGWGYLSPLLRLRPLYAELRKPKNRLRKHGETLKDGTFSATDRMGPLTMDARRVGLAEVLAIQNEINANAPKHLPPFTLIDAQEEARINELIDANTWPNRWTGDEARGDVLQPVRFTRDGGRQMQMLTEAALWSM